jgi:hypothetical protein
MWRRRVSVGDLPLLNISLLSDSIFTIACSSGLETDTQGPRGTWLKGKIAGSLVKR